MAGQLGERRQPCETCSLFAERFPSRTVKLGRQRADGRWFCEDHGTFPQQPDTALTALGLQRRGVLRAVQDAAAAALRLDVPAAELRAALEDVLAMP